MTFPAIEITNDITQNAGLTNFANELRRRGLRATPQRVAVISLFRPGEHLTADDIALRVQAVLSQIDRSTVYRTLQSLRDVGLLSETDLGGGIRQYELMSSEPHHHLICNVCGHVETIDDHATDSLRAEIVARTGFLLDIGHLALWGTCTHCQGTKKTVCDR